MVKNEEEEVKLPNVTLTPETMLAFMDKLSNQKPNLKSTMKELEKIEPNFIRDDNYVAVHHISITAMETCDSFGGMHQLTGREYQQLRIDSEPDFEPMESDLITQEGLTKYYLIPTKLVEEETAEYINYFEYLTKAQANDKYGVSELANLTMTEPENLALRMRRVSDEI